MINLAWHARAACAGQSTSAFYADEIENADQISMLRQICARCRAIDDCRAHSLAWEQYGFWAGMTESERTEEARRLRITRRSLRTARPT